MPPMELLSYLVVLVYVANFLLMSFAVAKQTGRSVWLFGKGDEPQSVPALLFRVGFAGAVIWPLVVATVVPVRDPIRNMLDGLVGDIVGHVLVAVGAAVATISQYHMGGSWRIGAARGEQGPIVDTGPFAYSRNPVFVGQITLFVGLFLVMPNVGQLLLTASVVIAANLQVRIEERVLSASFGDAYEQYRRRVRRWL